MLVNFFGKTAIGSNYTSALEVLGSGGDVELDLLFGKIDHVGGEEGLAMLLEVGLISIKHAVEPWQKLLCAVIGVEHNGDSVCWSNGTDVVSGRNRTSDGSFLVLVVDTLA